MQPYIGWLPSHPTTFTAPCQYSHHMITFTALHWVFTSHD